MASKLCRLGHSLYFSRKTPTLACDLHSCTWVLSRDTTGSTSVSAHQVFDKLPQLDAISANNLIGQFSRQKQYKDAIGLFCGMLYWNITPTQFTFGTVIPLSTAMRDIELGRQFHCCAVKLGLNSVVFVGTALLDFYAKLVSLDEAQRAFEDIQRPNVVSYTTLVHGYLKKGAYNDAIRLFDQMPERNVVSWNMMIGGLSQMGHNEEAVNLFVQMLRQGWWHQVFSLTMSRFWGFYGLATMPVL
ncbi:Pentatricopeptide repeat-containing protein At5g42450, mitochondrial [Linum grandiflorum]